MEGMDPLDDISQTPAPEVPLADLIQQYHKDAQRRRTRKETDAAPGRDDSDGKDSP